VWLLCLDAYVLCRRKRSSGRFALHVRSRHCCFFPSFFYVSLNGERLRMVVWQFCCLWMFFLMIATALAAFRLIEQKARRFAFWLVPASSFTFPVLVVTQQFLLLPSHTRPCAFHPPDDIKLSPPPRPGLLSFFSCYRSFSDSTSPQRFSSDYLPGNHAAVSASLQLRFILRRFINPAQLVFVWN